MANGVAEGGRNDAVTRLAGYLLRRWVDPVITHELLQAWNQACCRPPLPAERDKIHGYFASSTSRFEAAQDVMWALLNAKEFLFNH